MKFKYLDKIKSLEFKPRKVNIFSEKIARYGIKTRPFFWPMHEQHIFKKMKIFMNKKFPNSSHLARYGLYLPSYFKLKKKDIDYISSAINKILK